MYSCNAQAGCQCLLLVKGSVALTCPVHAHAASKCSKHGAILHKHTANNDQRLAILLHLSWICAVQLSMLPDNATGL